VSFGQGAEVDAVPRVRPHQDQPPGILGSKLDLVLDGLRADRREPGREALAQQAELVVVDLHQPQPLAQPLEVARAGEGDDELAPRAHHAAQLRGRSRREDGDRDADA